MRISLSLAGQKQSVLSHSNGHKLHQLEACGQWGNKIFVLLTAFELVSDQYRSNLIKWHCPNYLVHPYSTPLTLAQVVVYFLLQYQYHWPRCHIPAQPRHKSNSRHNGGFSNISPWIHNQHPPTSTLIPNTCHRRYRSRRSWLRQPMLCRGSNLHWAQIFLDSVA